MNKMNRFLAIAALALSALVGAASAQAQAFPVATGDLKGGSTYAVMFNEYAKVCGPATGINFDAVQTTGGVQNKDLLVGNKVLAAILPSDLLFYTKMKNATSVANFKTVFALHPEELHFAARGDVKKEGGWLGTNYGAKEVKYDTVLNLAGRQVGAVGGSVVSGEIAASQLGINFTMREYANNDLLKAALLSGEVDSILVVGGAPHGLVKTLDRRFKLLPIPADLIKKTTTGEGALYSAAQVDYQNLGQTGVNTIATQAVLVSRVFRDKDMVNQLAKMRACFDNNLGKIQDSLGTHPKWQAVDAANHGKWTWYDLPATK